MKLTVLYEKKGVKYDSSCVLLQLPAKLASPVMAWGKRLPDDDIYVDGEEFGREDDIHITIKYGLKNNKPDEVQELLRDHGDFEVKLGKMSLFKSDGYDVLKIEVDCPTLGKIHRLLKAELPNEETFPRYDPHVTIAYLKKGQGDNWVGNTDFAGESFKVDSLTFSGSDRKSTRINLGSDE